VHGQAEGAAVDLRRARLYERTQCRLDRSSSQVLVPFQEMLVAPGIGSVGVEAHVPEASDTQRRASDRHGRLGRQVTLTRERSGPRHPAR
jgi:hypothetical protein